MHTRRTFLASAVAASTACAVARGQEAATQPDGGYDQPTHEEWQHATIGYYEFCKGVVQPCVVEGTGHDGKPKREVWTCRPWLNVILPGEGVDMPWLGGWVGTTSKDKFRWGRPVQPPVYTLDDQLLMENGLGGTRIGYAAIGAARFFPWHGVLVEPTKVLPEFRQTLSDLRIAAEERRGGFVPGGIESKEIWIPPDRVRYLKKLSPPYRDPEADRFSAAVTLVAPIIGATASFGFGDESFTDDEPAGKAEGP